MHSYWASTWLFACLILLGFAMLVFFVIRKDLRRASDYLLPTDSGNAIPLDVENPPKVMVYKPKSGRSIYCTCHNEPLAEGDNVLWWPVPGSAQVKIFCGRWLAELTGSE